MIYDRLGRPIRRTDPYERVMRDVARDGDCLVFTGPRNKQGYGRVYLGANRQGLAHRVVWRHHNPDAAEPEAVMHRCDNPPCVRIEHLIPGTRALNQADMAAKGRAADTRGERSGKARLTDSEVVEIREARALGLSTTSLGAVFGVHPSHISRIASGKRRAEHPAEAKERGFLA